MAKTKRRSNRTQTQKQRTAVRSHRLAAVFGNDVSTYRSWKKRSNQFMWKMARSATIPFALIFIGLSLIGISSTHRYLQYRSLVLGREAVETYQGIEANRPAKPTHIFIRWFVDTDIESRTFVNGEWSISENYATYLVDSARPSEAGNIILYGHNRRDILGNIRALKGNEEILLTTSDGKEHHYRVESLHEVNPTDVTFVGPTSQETLTIYTCSGLLDSKRFIVVSKPF